MAMSTWHWGQHLALGTWHWGLILQHFVGMLELTPCVLCLLLSYEQVAKLFGNHYCRDTSGFLSSMASMQQLFLIF